MSQSRERYAEQVDQFVTALVRLQKSMERLSSAADAAGRVLPRFAADPRQ